MKKISGAVTGLLLLSGCSLAQERNAIEKTGPTASTPIVFSAPRVPAKIDFAGEAVPLQQQEVREQLDRDILFNYYWQNNIFYMMKLSARYFPAIEAELKKNGVPDDFKYLCIAESNLLNAVSKAGATGFWQFMKSTAPGYDLEISETVDERYHVEKATAAACRYFKQAYARFGNWIAAAASYNCGMGGYSERAAFQRTNNYYELVLPEETQRYIYRILAYKHILSNADSLGFVLAPEERYAPVKTKTIPVNFNISNLLVFANNNGSTYKLLKWYNPWLRGRSLRVRPGKTYNIILPLATDSIRVN
ncbi:MAG: lytic transglycosylase domain-containing protein [Ferruginibacter sp.]